MVNAISGNLSDSVNLFSISGTGLMPGMTLYYSSAGPITGPLGRNWSHSYYTYLVKNGDDSITVTEGTGTKRLYTRVGNLYTSQPGDYSTLSTNGVQYQLTEKDGTIYLFDSTSGKLLSITDRNGNTVTLTYTAGFLTSIADPYGRTIGLAYEDGKIVAVVDPASRVTVISYDPTTGNLSSIIDPAGNAWNYDGLMLAKADPKGNVTSYKYDTGARLAASIGPYGTKTYSYSNPALQTSQLTITDSEGTWKYTYDTNLAILTDISGPNGAETKYAYDYYKNVISKTDPEGNTTNYGYDNNGNMITMIDPMNNATYYTYNTWGKATSITDAAGNVTSLTYDAKGNLLSFSDPLGNTATFTYDTTGKLLTITDPKGKTTSYIYDSMGRPATVTDALGGTTAYTYTIDDQIATVTDAKQDTIRYDYDYLGRPVKMTDQLGNIESYTYDQFGNLHTVTDRKGQMTAYTYDSLNRVINAAYADGSYTTYTYDMLGRLTTINDSVSGVITYAYTITGCDTGCSAGTTDKITSETTPFGSVSYVYDRAGRRASMTVAGQPTVNYGYDGDSRLTEINTTISGNALNFILGYDALSRRATLTLANGVMTTYSYDNGSRLLNLQHLNPVEAVLESINYSYDANGNRTTTDRLSVSPPIPTLPVSNILYNAANQMLTFDTDNITYDANGNMTSRINGCGTTTYAWDARNRLTGINGFKTDCSALTASFIYDALGRRIHKTINGSTIQYVYDGRNIVQEIENGLPTVDYIRTLNIDEPLARIESNGLIRYRFYQRDALGSVIALTDENGAIMTQYVYDPFGKVTIIGEVSDNPFQYTGRENDGTGLYYYRARYYSPELQRFVSEDPIGLAGGSINFYSYAANSPINRIDPLGLVFIGIDPVLLGETKWFRLRPISPDDPGWSEWNPRWEPGVSDPLRPPPQWYDNPWWPWNWWSHPEPPHPHTEPPNKRCAS